MKSDNAPNRLCLFRRVAIVGAVLPFVLAGCETTGNVSNTNGLNLTPPVEEFVPGLVQKAEEAFADGRIGEAYRYYGKILSADKNNLRAKFGIGETLLAMGKAGAAVDVFRSIETDDEFRARSLQGKGIALLMSGDRETGHGALRQAVSEDSALWRAWNALGQYYDTDRKWDEARECYDNALAANGDRATFYNNIGVSMLLQGRYEEAEQEFLIALKLSPSNEITCLNLRLSLAWQGKYIEAMSGVNRSEIAETLNNIGYIALLREDYASAQIYLTRALEESPDFLDAAWRNIQFLETRRLQKGSSE